MSRLVRAEREHNGNLLFIVAGERGAVELRHCPNYSCFYVHSPRPWAGMYAIDPKSVHGPGQGACHILESWCWAGLVPGEGYDFDAPDVNAVPQWKALEDLYELYLGGGR